MYHLVCHLTEQHTIQVIALLAVYDMLSSLMIWAWGLVSNQEGGGIMRGEGAQILANIQGRRVSLGQNSEKNNI